MPRNGSLVAMAMALSLVGCGGSERGGGALYVLLADHRLVVLSADRHVLARTRLGPAPAGLPSFGGLLAVSPDRRIVYARPLVLGFASSLVVLG